MVMGIAPQLVLVRSNMAMGGIGRVGSRSIQSDNQGCYQFQMVPRSEDRSMDLEFQQDTNKSLGNKDQEGSSVDHQP